MRATVALAQARAVLFSLESMRPFFAAGTTPLPVGRSYVVLFTSLPTVGREEYMFCSRLLGPLCIQVPHFLFLSPFGSVFPPFALALLLSFFLFRTAQASFRCYLFVTPFIILRLFFCHFLLTNAHLTASYYLSRYLLRVPFLP